MKNSVCEDYEYKNIAVRRDCAELYVYCLGSFGWAPCDAYGQNTDSGSSDIVPVLVYAAKTSDSDIVSLKFRRFRSIRNKAELQKLQLRCEEALTSVGSLENRADILTVRISLASGLAGTAFICAAAYAFSASYSTLGVLAAAAGFAGCCIGYFSDIRAGRRMPAGTNPLIKEQLAIAHSASEQGYALLSQ